MTSRRGFLLGMLAAGAAPAIVRADALMRIVPRDATVLPGWVTFTDDGARPMTTADFERIWREAAERACNPPMLVDADGSVTWLNDRSAEMLIALTPPDRQWFTLR